MKDLQESMNAGRATDKKRKAAQEEILKILNDLQQSSEDFMIIDIHCESTYGHVKSVGIVMKGVYTDSRFLHMVLGEKGYDTIQYEKLKEKHEKLRFNPWVKFLMKIGLIK